MTMRRIWAATRLLAAVGLLSCGLPAWCYALAIGEVVSRSERALTIRDASGSLVVIDDPNRVEIVAEARIGPAELAVGQMVMVQGGPAERDRIQVRMIRVLPPGEAPPSALSAPAGQPITGRISAIKPMVLQSGKGDIGLIIDDRTDIFQEQRVPWQGLEPGKKLVLIGGPGPPRKIILIPDDHLPPGPPRLGGNSRLAAGPQGLAVPPARPVLPMPSIPTINRFSAETMAKTRHCRFGLKDPLMYRMDPLSWFEGYAEAMAELGIHWMEPAGSFGIGPASVGQADGTFNWRRFDRLVANAQAVNIHMTVILHATEENYQGTGRPIPAMPKDLPAYRRFVSAAVERYDGDGSADMPGLLYPIRHWKIEDEAMLRQFFDGRGSEYAQIVAAAYDSIKAADPGATVILSMLRGYDALPTPVTAFMDDFLATAAAIGRGPFWDVMDHHWMVYGDPASYPLQYRNIASELAEIRARLKHYGLAERPVWCMEIAGLYSSRPAQAIDLFKRLVYALSQRVEKVFWSGLAESPEQVRGEVGGIAMELFRQAALIDATGKKKASFHTLRHLVETIDGFADEDLRVLRDDHGLFLVEIVVDRRPLWIAWNDQAAPQSLNLATGMGKAAFTIEDAVPQGPSPDGLDDQSPVFSIKTASSAKDGMLVVDLGEIPVIITPRK